MKPELVVNLIYFYIDFLSVSKPREIKAYDYRMLKRIIVNSYFGPLIPANAILKVSSLVHFHFFLLKRFSSRGTA